MSGRCPNPMDCQCPLLKDEDFLRCGCCKKCKKRADTMCSSLMTVDGSLQFIYDYENRNQGMPLTAGAKIQHDVIRCLRNFPQVCKGWLGQHSVIMPIAKGGLHAKKRKKYGRTQRCRKVKKCNSSISG